MDKANLIHVQVVRELYGVMIDQRASAAKLVATTSFTPDAVAFTKGKPIELVDSNALLHLVSDVQTTSRLTISSDQPYNLTPNCPRCNTPMVMREARRGGITRARNSGAAQVIRSVAARGRFELSASPERCRDIED